MSPRLGMTVRHTILSHLISLGYAPCAAIRRTSDVLKLRDYEAIISVDYIANIGETFVQIKSWESPRVVRSVMRLVGIEAKDVVKQTYIELVHEKLKMREAERQSALRELRTHIVPADDGERLRRLRVLEQQTASV